MVEMVEMVDQLANQEISQAQQLPHEESDERVVSEVSSISEDLSE